MCILHATYSLLGTGLENEVLPTSTDEEHCSAADSERPVSVRLLDLNTPSNGPVHLDAKTVDLLVEKGLVIMCSFIFISNQEKKKTFLITM